MNTRIRIPLSLAVAAALAAATQVAAQEGATSQQMIVLDEVVITAEKREEKLQDAPLAVSAYTEQIRELLSIRGVEDYAAFTPGLNFSSNDRITLRGIGQLTDALGSDPGVAIYTDGFYSPNSPEINRTPLFIERVEVLRGPQGTLYGRNSIGGAINVISKRPERGGFASEVRIRGGNYDTMDVEGFVSAPLTDSFRVRLSAQSRNRDQGFFENDLAADKGREDRQLYELQLDADLGERVNAWLRLSYNESSSDNSDGALNVITVDPYFSIDSPGGTVFPAGSLVPNAQFLAAAAGLVNPSVNDVFDISQDLTSNTTRRNSYLAIGEVTADLGNYKLKYVGGYSQFDFKLINDFDAVGLQGPVTSFPATIVLNGMPTRITGQFLTPVFPQYTSEFIENTNYYSNEINLTSNGEGRFNWILGLYQFHEDTENPLSLLAPGNAAQINNPFLRAAATGLAPATTLAAANDRGRYFFANGELDSDSYAAFGQIDYMLNERWSLTAGLRYNRDEKAGDEQFRIIAFLPIPVALGGSGTGATDVSPTLNMRRLEDSWDNITGKFSLQYAPSDTTLVYASYNRGYKSGGFNLGTIIGGNDPNADSVDEETINAYEIGFKSDISKSFRVNGSFFFYDFMDAQVPFTEFRTGVNITNFRNTDAESYGAEFESVWAPTDNLSFLINYSYLKTQITRKCRYASATDNSDCYFDTADTQGLATGAQPVGPDNTTTTAQTLRPNQLQDLEGNDLPGSPEHKVAFNGNYSVNLRGGTLTFSSTYTWQDSVTFAVFANPKYRVPQFGTTDFRISWNDLKDRYTLIAFAKNAFDKTAFLGAQVSQEASGATRQFNIGAPRVYGLEAQVRF
jgi:iron complex outermembrane recepter protein